MCDLWIAISRVANVMIACGHVVKENFQVGIMIGSGLPIVLIQGCQKQVKYIQLFFLKVKENLFKA